jgi:hypothetical protein
MVYRVILDLVNPVNGGPVIRSILLAFAAGALDVGLLLGLISLHYRTEQFPALRGIGHTTHCDRR